MTRLLAPALLLATFLAACADAPPGDAPAGPTNATERDGLRRELAEMPDEGQDSLRAEIKVPLGRVRVGEAEPGALVQVETVLPAAGPRPRVEATTERDGAATRAVFRLGLEAETAGVRDLRSLGRDVAWTLLLGRRAPTDLALDLGLADADLDLTGVPLARLSVRAGAGRTRLAFAAPNPVEMRELRVQAGVRAFDAEGLGWARARRLTFEGGVGRFAVDLSGGVPVPGAEALVRVGVGTLELTLPAAPARLIVAGHAPGRRVVPPEGFVVESEGVYASPGAGADALAVRVESGPGRVRVYVGE